MQRTGERRSKRFDRHEQDVQRENPELNTKYSRRAGEAIHTFAVSSP